MRILVTNDDGINAPGLDVCVEIARALSDDVWVVAPEFDQSGVSHSLSLNDPLRMRAVDERRFAIKGTPTDCVIMGVRHILDGRPPDLILSGVNRGQNAAEDVTYSGTIAGALEAAILGIPAFALSQGYGAANRQNPHWATATTHGPDIIRKVLAEGIPRDVLVNVNFPDCAPGDVKGIEITSQGKRDAEWLRIDPRHDGRGNPYFWIAFARGARPPSPPGTDLQALREDRISVTPLRFDMTDASFKARLAELFH
jgi:5'/3'-nucleotidase